MHSEGKEPAPAEDAGAGAAAPDDTPDPGLRPDRQWFAVHTYAGYEGKVKTNLEKRVESMLMEDKIFRVVVPTEEEYEYKDGKKRITKKKIFPGYVLVEMTMSDDSWYVVRNTPGVTGFVGSGSRPIPLQPAEMKAILRQMGMDEPKPKILFSVDENVRVISGPFDGFVGTIKEINIERGKVKLMVSMFGRETPVELEFGQLEKL